MTIAENMLLIRISSHLVQLCLDYIKFSLHHRYEFCSRRLSALHLQKLFAW